MEIWDFIHSLFTLFFPSPFQQFVHLRSDRFKQSGQSMISTTQHAAVGQRDERNPSVLTEAAQPQSRRPIKDALTGGRRASSIQPSRSAAPALSGKLHRLFTSELKEAAALHNCASSNTNLCSVLEIKTSYSTVLQNPWSKDIAIEPIEREAVPSLSFFFKKGPRDGSKYSQNKTG